MINVFIDCMHAGRSRPSSSKLQKPKGKYTQKTLFPPPPTPHKKKEEKKKHTH
jgi:hypothetical protein